MRRWILVAGLVGGVVATAAAGRKRFAPAKHYAALFAADRAWTYTVTRTVEHLQPSADGESLEVDSTDTDTTTTTCRVASVWQFRRSVMSLVVCDPVVALERGDEFIAALWFADGRGLNIVSERVPRDGTRPGATDLRRAVDARPKARDESEELEEGTVTTTTTKEAGAWCSEHRWQAMGNGGSTTLCFDKRGIRSGESTFDDESTIRRRMVFTRQ